MTSLTFVQASAFFHHLSSKRARVCLARTRTSKFQMAAETDTARSIIQTGEPLDSERLSSFAERTKGEWAGYEGSFDSSTGLPKTIPDFYIPDDFVSWNMYPKGFESNHSTIVRGTKLYQKYFRVLPAVALFADHVDLETSFKISNFEELPAFHFFADGSFSAGPSPVCTKHDSILDKWPSVDICIRDPRKPRSWAVHVQFEFDFKNIEIVGDVRVIREQFSCIYCDGADIEGSSGFVEGWVTGSKSKPVALKGNWIVPEGDEISRPHGGAEEVPKRHIYLPAGINVGVEGTAEDGVRAWVGWMVEPDLRVVMSRIFAGNGNVLFSKYTTERRKS